ncbi:NUDIX domain-containing protein [Brevibacillus migulae]|nr:NUDIX domain-containing protein [Brevibacillus migulae]
MFDTHEWEVLLDLQGETLQKAAIHEVKEETGLEVETGGQIDDA